MTHLGERITDYIFGELSATEMEEARRHVAECVACRDQVEQFELTRSMLKSSPDVDPPRRIVFEVEKPARAVWRWFAPIGVAAALAIAVLAATPIQIQRNDSQTTITLGKAPSLPAPQAPVALATPPVQPVAQPIAQPVDYDRIIKVLQDSQQASLATELKKRDVEQTRVIAGLQDQVVYQKTLLETIRRDTQQNASFISDLAQKSGARD